MLKSVQNEIICTILHGYISVIKSTIKISMFLCIKDKSKKLVTVIETDENVSADAGVLPPVPEMDDDYMIDTVADDNRLHFIPEHSVDESEKGLTELRNVSLGWNIFGIMNVTSLVHL